MKISLTNWQKKASLLLFIVGMFSSTQINLGGCIGISEIVIFAIAPFIFISNVERLRADGFMPFFLLIFLNMLGCVVASLVNGVRGFAIIKGLMTLYSMFSITVIFHALLRHNFYGIRWFLVGTVVSGIIKTFAFNPRVITSSTGQVSIGEAELEEKMEHPLFWMSRLMTVIQAVVCGWYFKVSIYIGYILCFIYAMVLTSVTVSGRAAIAISVMGVVMLSIAGKTNESFLRLKKYMLLYVIGMSIALVGIKVGYGYLAESGILGEKALQKYERQTRDGRGILDFLRSGRSEFFIGLSAIVDKPIMGFGAIPVDDKDYVLNYVSKHGTIEDYENLIRFKAYTVMDGTRIIPSHSHIVGFWLYNGIFGLLLWLYVLKLIYEYYRKTLTALPQVLPFVCFMTPTMVWDIFFSPYTNRFIFPLFITCILFCRAAYKGAYVSDSVDMGLIDEERR